MRRFEKRDNDIFEVYTKQKMTKAAIGRVYGMSRERVRQIVNRIARERGLNVQDIRPTRNW